MASVKEDENSSNKGEDQKTSATPVPEIQRAASPPKSAEGGQRHVRVAMFVDDDKDKKEREKERLEKERMRELAESQDSKNKDLAVENKVLQKRLLAIRKRRSTIGTKLFLDGADTQYQIALKQWMEAKQELDMIMDDYNDKIDRMQDVVTEKQEEASMLNTEFQERKWQVAREARHILSGKKLSNALLDELESKDMGADVEIERLRIEGRQLASQLKKIRQATLKKDQLSGNLFAVDYEQLKIENESLNERFQRKNKELIELGKKTTHIVHVLSHSRERLEFVQKKVKGDKYKLESLESELGRRRMELHKIRVACEKLTSKRERIQTTVNVRTMPLLDDMETYKDQNKSCEKRLKDLKNQYNRLVEHIERMQNEIRAAEYTLDL